MTAPTPLDRAALLDAARRLHDQIAATIAASPPPASLADRLELRDLRCAEMSLRIATDYLASAAGTPGFRLVA